MTTIDKLSAINSDDISESDLIPFFSNKNGDARRFSIGVFLDYLKKSLNIDQNGFVIQYAAPTVSESLITLYNNSNNIWLVLTSPGTLANLNVKLPDVSNCAGGQEIMMTTTNNITSLAVNLAGANSIGVPSTLTPTAPINLKFEPVTKTWYKV